jgi:hypothetical protein
MNRLMRTVVCGLGLTMALAVGMTGLTGCGSSNDASSTTAPSETNSAFVGTWALYIGSVGSGSVQWYFTFKADGTFFLSDAPNNPATSHVFSTAPATVTNGKLIGPFENAGTGTGRIEATITNNVISLDFIENWHTPEKHNPFVGQKV